MLRLEQFYLDCLSQASYLIGDTSTGRAVVVDPRRDVGDYLQAADEAGLSVELIVETHLHADFVSGHLELAALTGAEVAYGHGADVEFPCRHLKDGERLELGDVVLEVRATPGHTPESISVVVWEHADDEVPYGVLTGDTLFIGDVGRPDLLSSVGRSPADLAGELYDSLHGKLLTLPDATRVFPAHGAGSSCGRQLSTARQSTIGEQRVTNHALAPMTRERFIAVVTDGLPATPAYFSFDARRNREQHALLDAEHPPPPLTLDAVIALRDDGAVVLDTRSPEDFGRGHLVGSINVGLAGRFSEQAGAVVDPDDRIVVVADPGAELEASVRLARIGYDNVIGHLRRPYDELRSHPEVVAMASRISVSQLDSVSDEVGDLQLIDVRGPGETSSGTIPGARTVPLARLRSELGGLEPERPTVVYCAGGHRSSIAASLLRSVGFRDVSDLLGGYGAWEAAHQRG